jgi:hypothetical protein
MSGALGFTEFDERDGTPAFMTGMDQLDRLLITEKVPVPGRPLHAMRRIAMARKIEMVIGGSGQSATSVAVSRWYAERYGDRLKVDFSPGRAVILVRGDPLILKLPLIVGEWDGVADVTKLLPGLTQPMFASLSEGEMQDVVSALPWMQQRFAALEVLASSIRANLEAAIMQMTSQSPHFGESHWASLQFAEKTMKRFLRSKGRTPSRTHDLTALLRSCESAGLPRGMQPILKMIQCDAGVRYSEDVTLDAALAAHHASIDLTAYVAQHLVDKSSSNTVIDDQDLADLVLSMSFGIESSHNGNLLYAFGMADNSIRRLLFSSQHCNWLHREIASSIDKGRHKDDRLLFTSGRDIRNAQPRHPLNLFYTHMPEFGPEDYKATDIIQVKSVKASDESRYLVLEIEGVRNETARLIIWSELVAPLLETIDNGLAEGRVGGLFA